MNILSHDEKKEINGICGRKTVKGRELSKLRAHGLIRKIPHSGRYLVSDKGRRVMGALIEAKRKIYPEFAAC